MESCAEHVVDDEVAQSSCSRYGRQKRNPWMTPIREKNLVQQSRKISDSKSRGGHNLFIHFPKHPSCDVCKMTKLTGASADHNVLNVSKRINTRSLKRARLAGLLF